MRPHGDGLPEGALHVLAAVSASTALGNVHISSSPMFFTIVPWCRPAAWREDLQRLGDDGLGAGVAERLVQLGAAADVGEQDGQQDARVVLGFTQCMPGAKLSDVHKVRNPAGANQVRGGHAHGRGPRREDGGALPDGGQDSVLAEEIADFGVAAVVSSLVNPPCFPPLIVMRRLGTFAAVSA